MSPQTRAQLSSGTHYYWYKGNKIPITINTTKSYILFESSDEANLQLPLLNSKSGLSAAKVTLSSRLQLQDATRSAANDNLYFNVAGFGFDVDVLDETEFFKTRCKNGSIAYLRGLFASVKHLKSRKTQITWTDAGGAVQQIERNVLLIAAGNGTHFGGGMNVTPKADPFDGLLDICVIHDVTKAALLRVLPLFLRGKHLRTRYVTYFRAKELTSACDPVSRIEVVTPI
ncbi:MAG: hypothetical protein BHV68_09250 [Bacteroidales bacterium 43_8]|nr:MAG: hypothetical protein BHV68_09250 [Bacteroidales bacterium 43_8]